MTRKRVVQKIQDLTITKSGGGSIMGGGTGGGAFGTTGKFSSDLEVNDDLLSKREKSYIKGKVNFDGPLCDYVRNIEDILIPHLKRKNSGAVEPSQTVGFDDPFSEDFNSDSSIKDDDVEEKSFFEGLRDRITNIFG